MTFLYVAAGGAIGALLRYILALFVVFPLGTLLVNILGSFLMGVCFIWFSAKGFDRVAVFAMTGVLGGFTTFSAFSLDTFRLFERGDAGLAVLYILASVCLSLLALWIGIATARGFA